MFPSNAILQLLRKANVQHRIYLLIGAAIYPLWYFVFQLLGAPKVDSFPQRLVIGAGFLVAWVLTGIVPWCRKYCTRILYALLWVVTWHYVMLSSWNQFSSNHLIGVIATVSAISSVLYSARALLAYAVFSMATLCFYFFQNPPNDGSPTMILSGIATVFLPMFVMVRQRNHTEASLRASEQKVRENEKFLLEQQMLLTSAAKMSALGEMAATLAHEVNSPLGTIAMNVGNLHMLLEEQGSQINVTDAKKLCEDAETVIKRMAHIVKGLRVYSRAPGEKETYAKVPLRSLIEDTLVLCRDRMKKGSVLLRYQPPPVEWIVLCNAVQISQVFLNLLNNSYDAVESRSERWIWIDCQLKGRAFEISVCDSGEGISPGIKDKLLNTYVTTKPIEKGTGLGLSISKGIMESHGGTLVLDEGSQATRFVLTLPALVAEKAA